MEKRALPIKEIIISYLAINKVFYWGNYISQINLGEWGEAGTAIFFRLIGQDIFIILLIIAFLVLERQIEKKQSKDCTLTKNIILYSVGALVILAVSYIYFLGANLIFTTEFNLANYTRGFVSNGVPSALVLYIASSIFLEFKERKKKKNKKIGTLEDKHDSLMLLLKEGVLSKEEYDSAIERLANEQMRIDFPRA